VHWSADGKVKHLDELHPELAPQSGRDLPAATFAARPEQIDLLSAVKASQVISREVIVDKLLRALLEVVLAQSGAEKALLMVPRDGALSIEARAFVTAQRRHVQTQDPVPVASSSLVPQSVVQYVWRTHDSVVLGDAATEQRFADDEYIRRERPRSVLCLPILRQAEVVGLLYLENNALPGAFTPGHLTVLELLAAQAAISLDNASLLEREQSARKAVEASRAQAAFLAEAGLGREMVDASQLD
jgi:GAF domain-containing protein